MLLKKNSIQQMEEVCMITLNKRKTVNEVCFTA